MSISIDDITATKCSAFEQETVIQISRNRDTVSIWTSDNTQLKKNKAYYAQRPQFLCLYGSDKEQVR